MKTSLRAPAALAASFLFASQPVAQFKPALPGYHYEFPRDYFSHPDYQTEWWYYTGNLQSADRHKFGFELTFFRFGVSRDGTGKDVWDIRDLYLAHFAVSDLDRKNFFHAERTNRSGPGIAGADYTLQKVWNGSWSVTWKDGHENLQAVAEGFSIELSLQPQKPPVIHGANGVSQKSAGAGRASHYFSETRLLAAGWLQSPSRKYEVTGQAWMDHEFFTQQLAPDQAGWDWLSLQLDDHTELMLFRLRRKDGSIDPFSAGTFVDAEGRARHLSADAFQLEPTGEIWTSGTTHARYPIRWKIAVPALALELETYTLLPSQELAGNSKISPTYWEGAIDFDGKKGTETLNGKGYLEMTGYDHPLNID
jgi:predicted secreted hydrolase